MNQPPPPLQDAIATPRDWQKYPKPSDKDPNEGLMTDPWTKYNQFQSDSVQATPRIGVVASYTAQSASLSTTPWEPGTFSSGLYRLTYTFRVTQAASVSSSLLVSFIWTDGGLTQGKSSTAVTGNTTTTTDSLSYMVSVDANTPISYSTTYASVGGTVMTYSISLTLENMNG